MQHYYLYHLLPNGRFAGREVIEADDDAVALQIAERSSRGQAMELWFGPRKVAQLPSRTPGK